MHDQNTIDKSIRSMRAGWTVIELIFIIVIIAILAATALPRLAATRDDAKLAADISNMAVCIKDSASQYMATGSIGNSQACDNIVCYSITDTSPDNFTVITVSNADSYCTDIDIVGGDLAKIYSFKGTRVSR